MNELIYPEDGMKIQAFSSLDYANSYFKILKKSLSKEHTRFTNDLLYNFAVMSFEKYFIALLARFDWNAEHHMPMALYNEAKAFEPNLTEQMKETAKLISQFESICSLDGFGYKTPAKEELLKMEKGLDSIKELVESRLIEVGYVAMKRVATGTN
jgi:hypothetical protein